MPTPYENTVLDEVLEPLAQCFTPHLARQIAALRAPPTLQARLDELASKADEVELTEQEREQFRKLKKGSERKSYEPDNGQIHEPGECSPALGRRRLAF